MVFPTVVKWAVDDILIKKVNFRMWTAYYWRLDEHACNVEDFYSSLHFFMSLLAWNLAVQFRGCPEKMRDFFLLSFKVRTFASTISDWGILSSV